MHMEIVRAYGTLVECAAPIARNENLGRQLAHGYPYLEAEESFIDLIARKTYLALLKTDAEELPQVSEILANEHK